MRLLSLILCFGGAAALIVYGVLSILVPSVPAQISGSSMIRIDGSGIFSAALRRGHRRGRGAAAQKAPNTNKEVSP